MEFNEFKTKSYDLNVDLQKLSECCANMNCTAEDILFSAYCLSLRRKTGYGSFVIGYTPSDEEVYPVKIEIDGQTSSAEAINDVLNARGLAVSGNNTISRSYLALFGLPGSEVLLEYSLASGHIAAMPESFSDRGSGGRSLKMSYIYKVNSFTDDEVRVNHLQFETLLSDLLSNPKKQVEKLCIISDFEKSVIKRVNDTSTGYSDDKCIHEFVEGVAARVPDLPALRFCGEEMSYGVFNERVNRLAHTLRSLGAGPGEFVAIAALRSHELIIAMFAALKTGAAYVPLSMRYPPEMIVMILKRSGVKLFLTNTMDAATPLLPEGVIAVDLNDPENYSGSCENLPRPDGFSPKSVASLVYTSGTTGIPKGVLIRHDTVVNYCEFNLREFKLTENDVIMQFAPFVFSTAILEITTTLISGAKLCLVPEAAVADPRAFYKEMTDVDVTCLLAPPEYITYLPMPPTLRIVETGASECSREISQKIVSATRHVNCYGLTEGSVPTVWKDGDGERPKRIPIGKPVPNTKVYIIDKNVEECGMYMPGELCVTGLAVSDGYLNDPVGTAERFIKNPFGDGIMLRTGDIAQWNADGDVEYLGREDNQVQIRGMRVELEEVERTLKQIPGIASAAVIPRQLRGGDSQLCAFITTMAGEGGAAMHLDVKSIKSALYDRLLEHKVPSIITQIEKMPLTGNGKVDKRALAAIEIAEAEYAAPQNYEEELCIKAFEETLGISGISTKDSFFALGGHSLRAANAANLLEKLSGVRIPLSKWFEAPTAEELAKVLSAALEEISEAKGAIGAKAYEPIPKAEELSAYPMSPAQRRIYLTCQIDDVKAAYNIPAAVEFSGAINIEKVQKAVRVLINRHEALRTSFYLSETEGFMQQISKNEDVEIPIEIIALSEGATCESLLDAFVRPFDLSKPKLMRVGAAIAEDGSRSILLFDIHHIIADGTTVNLILAEFEALYNGRALQELPVQYKDFSQWARKKNLEQQKAYWLSVFEELAPPLNMVSDFLRPPRQGYTQSEVKARFSKDLRTKLDVFSQSMSVTPFMTMLSTLMVLTGKYGNQEDVTIASPVSGRIHQDTETMAGMFVNTLVLRGAPSKDKVFADFLNEVKQSSLLAFENQEYPYEELVETLGVQRDPSRSPLFDVCLIMQNKETYTVNLNSLGYVRTSRGVDTAKFDLSFEVTEDRGEYFIRLVYRADMFLHDTAERILRHYLALLDGAISDPSRKIDRLSLMDNEEYERTVNGFSRDREVGAKPPINETFVSLFEAAADKYPNQPALALNDECITYSELKQKSEMIADWLISTGVKPEDRVALFNGRGFGHVIGALGIMKAGAAYLPIDFETPKDRVRFILEDSGSKAVLLADAEMTFVTSLPVLDISGGVIPETVSREKRQIPEIRPNNLAYCIYTSGSTGTPKGVMVEHAGLPYLAAYFVSKVNIDNRDVVLQFSNSTFDASVLEILLALSTGAALRLLPPGGQADPDILNENIKRSTVAVFVPPIIPLIKPAGLRLLITGGSPVSAETVQIASKGNDMYINGYGPTEATVCVVAWEYNRGDDIPERVPIGFPLPGVRAYILDGLTPCAIGVPGELCIGGALVSRGYINRPDLNAEKYIENPFGSGRLYRTGDIARWLPDGQIEYLWRNDGQVKIRGFRVELEEIETLMRKFPGVRESAVTASQQDLIGYIAAEPNIDVSALKNSLQEKLPYYMVPATIVVLGDLPKTKSGKIDKLSLPAPIVSQRRAVDPDLPRTREEALISWVFGEVLDVGPVGIYDNFFALGGNSLRVIGAVNMIESISGVRLPIRYIFENPTVEGLALVLCKATKEAEGQDGQNTE